MPGTDPISSSSPVAALARARDQSLLGETQDRFLTLLVTQLRNQDPLNPMDNAQVTSQIAQLSTVNGIQQLNNTLQALSGQVDMTQSLQAANLIGRDVLFPGDRIALGSDPTDPTLKAATPFGLDLLSPARLVTVSIHDAAGAVVRQIELDAQDPGVYPLIWDGLDNSGAPAPDGAYSVSAHAVDADDQPVSVQALTYGQVRSVAYGADGLKLDLGLAGQIALMDVRQVM